MVLSDFRDMGPKMVADEDARYHWGPLTISIIQTNPGRSPINSGGSLVLALVLVEIRTGSWETSLAEKWLWHLNLECTNQFGGTSLANFRLLVLNEQAMNSEDTT